MNILITGYNGFIGKNLVHYLEKQNNIKLFKFGKNNNLIDLEKYVKKCQIIFHLAGENRNKNHSQFIDNNFKLTKDLVNFIRKKKKKTYLIFSSSNQIKNKKNIYTKTKLSAEKHLKKNVGKNLSVKIYRFTNIFGKWAKPNYNSVIATFSYRISRNREIKISSHNEEIEFLHIDEVIKLFYNDIKNKKLKNFLLIKKFDNVHKIKLFDLVKKLKYFHNYRQQLINNTELALGFDKLLYSTFLTYIPIKQFKYYVKPKNDKRGSFLEFAKSKNNGQISILLVKPNQERGNHYHMTKVERFLKISGQGVFFYKNMITGERKKIKVVSSKTTIVETIPGWAHSIKNTGKKDLIFVLWSNEIFNKKKPDTVYYELNSK